MKKIIFDHDLGGDCDDAAAAAIVIKAHKAGECRCLAITHAIGDHNGAYVIKALCEYFGVDDIEIGCNRENSKCSDEPYRNCTKATAEKYFRGREMPEPESNIRIIRRIMANNGGKKDITLVTTGPLITIDELYKSGADDISPKTGRELVRETVAEFVCGAGCFSDPNCHEWNIVADLESALNVINDPAIPMIFVGNNVGGPIFTGHLLRDFDENYPVRDCYLIVNEGKGFLRNSWDLVTMYYAIYGGCGYWEQLDGYDVRVLENECTYVKKGGIHSYVRQIGDSGEITELLDRAMMP
jgi:hypothetical protein